MAAAATVCLLVVAPAAQAAGTVTISGIDDAAYTGDAGVNNLTVTDAPQGMGIRVTFLEPGITALAPCVQMGANAAFCDIGLSDGVDVELGDGNDVTTLDLLLAEGSARGEGGDDTITGSAAELDPFGNVHFERLSGGDGTDVLLGRAGDEELDGGPGNGDLSDGGPGDDGFSSNDELGTGDVARGGPGFDYVFTTFYGPDPVPATTIDLGAGTAGFPGLPVLTLESVEDAFGDAGDDVLLGDAGVNDLEGEQGNDTIDGRDGPDQVDGEAGDDHLEARDGFADLVEGGTGVDICDSDQLDTRSECESGELVELPPFGSVVADRVAPDCEIRGVRSRVRRARLRTRGLSVSVSCDESGRASVRLLGRLRRVGARAARAGDIELASRNARLGDDRRARLKLRVPRALRRMLRRGARLRVVATVSDSAGNRGTATKRVRVR